MPRRRERHGPGRVERRPLGLRRGRSHARCYAPARASASAAAHTASKPSSVGSGDRAMSRTQPARVPTSPGPSTRRSSVIQYAPGVVHPSESWIRIHSPRPACRHGPRRRNQARPSESVRIGPPHAKQRAAVSSGGGESVAGALTAHRAQHATPGRQVRCRTVERQWNQRGTEAEQGVGTVRLLAVAPECE